MLVPSEISKVYLADFESGMRQWTLLFMLSAVLAVQTADYSER